MLPIPYYLFLSIALLIIGVTSALIRRNLLVKLFSVQLILIGASLNFMAFARLFADAPGQLFAFLIIFVATAEILVALAIVAAVFRWQHVPPADDSAREGASR
jgi:NADH:ubiquinone oxidoreductase subunit K